MLICQLDCLDTFPTIKVAIGYKDPRTGEQLESFPADLSLLETCEVIYKDFEGWQTTTVSRPFNSGIMLTTADESKNLLRPAQASPRVRRVYRGVCRGQG